MNVGSGNDERVKAGGEPIANLSEVKKLESKLAKSKRRGWIISLILFILGWILPQPWTIWRISQSFLSGLSGQIYLIFL